MRNDKDGFYLISYFTIIIVIFVRRLMIELDEQESNYLSICKHYRAILVTPKIINNEEERKAVMKNVALYIVLASYDNEQSDLIHRILQDKHIQEVPVYK